MNLMTQAVESIYKNGNAILHLNKDPNWKIMFYVGDNGKLNIRTEQDFGHGLIESSDLDAKEGLLYISLLAYYSLFGYARKNDLVYLNTVDKEFNSESSLIAINELYKQLMPLISAKKDNIEHLAKGESEYYNYYTFINLSKYTDGGHKKLCIQDIMKSLVKTYELFEKTLVKAIFLWRKMGEGSIEESNEAANNWNDFLNQLYINQFFDSSKVDINSININYEFLTSKKYISNPAIDCEDVIENLEIALLTPSKSAMLVGPPGIGKTAAAEGLAYMINSGHVPPALQNKKILKINTSSIVSGCSLLGEFEEKVEKIMQYLIENPDTILLVDEIHTTIGAGVGSKGALDLANIMKPYLDRGEIKVIGATTEEEYEEHIKSDKAFNRRFQIINVSEPQQSAVRKIMEETIEKLEQTTNVKWDFNTDISEMIISHITECTNEKNRVYNNKRYNPDISLTVLENAFALALLRGNDSVSIENISEAIRRSDFLYKSVRTTSADKLLSKYHSSNQDEPIGHNRCKIIKFPNTK